ncbi:hypothetical protein GCM10011331_06270 [Flavimobilis marinus]|nr:helix-turn-helix domain-containing protein [Flavimobilis marinus]GHG46314.1 hypothetical protein GCM10011331_06270 [Flavimobilis marinus]
MDTAALIRDARSRAGMSQGTLARRAGTSQPAISRYEAGVASPSVETLDRLFAAMGFGLELTVRPQARSLDVRSERMAKLRRHRRAILAAAHRHGAANLAVFGSVAAGTDGPTSDIDLLVDIDVRTRGLMPILELQDELETLLREKVDVAPRSALALHVAARALTEAVPL